MSFATPQATLQPVLSWNSQAHSKEPQQQAQQNLALSHKLEQVPEGRPVQPAANGNTALETTASAIRTSEMAQTSQHAELAGEPARTAQQNRATLKCAPIGSPSQTGRAPVLTSECVSARPGCLGASGQPAVSPAVHPAQASSAAIAAETTAHAAEKLTERVAQEAATQERAHTAAAAEAAVSNREGQCSSGSEKGGRRGAQGAAKRVFATLEPELPRSLSNPAGYTDTFAFPDADADASAAAATSSAAGGAAPRPSVKGQVEAAAPGTAGTARLHTRAKSAVGKGSKGVEPGQKLPEEEEAGGNASHSSPSSPGTPGSPGQAAHQPPAAAAGGAAGSQSGDSGPADQPTALSSTGGVRPPARGVTAAALRPAEADQAAVKFTDNLGANGAATSLPGAAVGSAGRDVASAPGSGRVSNKESLRQEHGSARNTHQHSDILKQQRSARGGAGPLVNPAMERARAASGSAGSLSRPARRQQSDSAAVSLETESLPRQTASATPMQRTTDAEVAAAQVKVSAATNAPATSGHGGVQRTSGKAAGDRVDDAGVTSGTASKRRRAPEGDSGKSRAKRGRAADTDATQPEPEPSGQSNLNGAIEEASPAEQPAAAATGNPGMSLDVLAAAASSVIAATPVHCWPRRRTSIGGTPSKNGSRAGPAAAAAAASTPGKPGAAKRPSPLIKWPAAAEAMPDKSATTASPKSPARGETASEQKPLQAAKTPARAPKKQPGQAAQMRPNELTEPAQGTPLAGHTLRNRSASTRKPSKPWWVV